MRFKLLFLVFTVLLSFSLPVFSQQEMVRMVYFYGKDGQIQQNEIETKMTGLANQLLDIYEGLVFEKENEAFVVHIVQGRRNASDYILGQGIFNLFAAEPEEQILDEIREEKNFDMSKDLYLVVANVDNPGQICGEGGTVIGQDFGDRFWSGKQSFEGAWALIYESATCVDEISVYLAAHELGHAFGLRHDFRNPSYIMSYGVTAENNNGTIQWQTPDQLSPCAAEWLKVSKFFATNNDLANSVQNGTFGLASKPVYSPNTQELRVQFSGAGVNAIHQVQLHVIQTTIPYGYLPKDPERDSKWADFNNKYSLHRCHTFQNSQNNTDQIVFQNVSLSNNSPNNKVKLHVIDNQGNITSADLTADVIEFKNTPEEVETLPVQSHTSDQHTETDPPQESRLRATLRGHTDFVTSVAFSPHGRTLATGSWDDTIRLWNPRTAEHIRTLTGHSHDVTSVAFHPTGNQLASGGWDAKIGVWDLTPKAADPVFYDGYGGFVTSVAYLPISGQKLAWGSEDNYVRVTAKGVKFPKWSSYDTGHYHGSRYRYSQSHGHDVSSVTFSPNEKTLASGSWDNTIILWSTDLHLEYALNGHTDFVTSIAFSPNGKTLASGSWDNTIILWDMATKKTLLILKGHTDRVLAVAFSPDGRTLASGSDDQTIRLWDVTTGQQRDTLLGHTSGVTAVTFSPDRRTLASAGGWDNTVRLWDLSPAPTPVPTIRITPSPVVSPAVGENLVVKIDISGVQNVAGYQATVHFDPTALRYVESANGTYLPTGSLFVPPVVNANQVTLAATSLSDDSDGAGTLATLTFEVVAVKPSKITLSDIMIMEQDLTSIPIIVQSSDVVVQSDETLDVNGDGVVNLLDLTVVASHFGMVGDSQADVNGDSVVDILIFLKSTQKSVSINGLSIRGYENAKKCQLICPQYVKNIPYFQYKIE